MKILVGTVRDSTNQLMINVVKKLIKNGHEIVIYDIKNDKTGLWMFKELGIEIRSSNSLF